MTDILPLGFKDLSRRGQRHRPERPRPTTTRRPSTSAPSRACTASTCPTGSTPTRRAVRPISSPRTRATPASGATTPRPSRVKRPRGRRLRSGLRRQPARRIDLGDDQLGRLNVTKELGFDETAGCYSELYAFGGRSFSIWTTDGTQVYDSGDSFEEVTHAANPDFFNSNHTTSDLEGRSDDKGPEPENLSIGTVGDRTYAFIGFERVGGIAVYDITDPAASSFVTYVNNRDFSVSVEDADDPDAVLSQAGDLGPEGVTFIPATSSATGSPLLAVANEVSGTTTLFSVVDLLAPVNTAPPSISGSPDVTRTAQGRPRHVDAGRRHRQGHVRLPVAPRRRAHPRCDEADVHGGSLRHRARDHRPRDGEPVRRAPGRRDERAGAPALLLDRARDADARASRRRRPTSS